MSDRAFTNPNLGREVLIKQYGREVHLIFVASTQRKSKARGSEPCAVTCAPLERSSNSNA